MHSLEAISSLTYHGQTLQYGHIYGHLPIYGSIFRYLKMGEWVSGGKNCSLVTNALFGSNLKFDFDITDRLSGMVPIDASVFIKFKYYLKLTNIWPQGSIQKRSHS